MAASFTRFVICTLPALGAAAVVYFFEPTPGIFVGLAMFGLFWHLTRPKPKDDDNHFYFQGKRFPIDHPRPYRRD